MYGKLTAGAGAGTAALPFTGNGDLVGTSVAGLTLIFLGTMLFKLGYRRKDVTA